MNCWKRKERDKIERDLLKDIDTLECNVNQASIQLLENKKQDLENIRKEKIKGKIYVLECSEISCIFSKL
jgi:hypothetical protein